MTIPSSTIITTEVLTSIPADELKLLVQLVNDVYDVAEEGMWKQTGVRTNFSELSDLIAQRRLIVARACTSNENDDGDDDDNNNNRIVGCVKVERLETAGEFGMLVVDPSRRSMGIGGKLIGAAEEWARSQGFQEMQLELLTPRAWKQPSKEFNKLWYSRLGYKIHRTDPFEKDYPQLIPLLATDCDFTIWKKPLA
jgi:GNAT superfamily N-acetyltransferase